MKKILRNIFLFLGTGSLSVLLAACYGVPFMYGRRPASIRVLFLDSLHRSPISGLKITGPWSSQTNATDTSGCVELTTANFPTAAFSVSIDVEDVDGLANLGDFSKSSQEISLQEYFQEIILPSRP